LLFEDEGTFYRQPTQAWLWASLGRVQPRLRYSCRSNCRMRVVATLEAGTGAVHAEQMSRVSADRLARYVAGLSARYPEAATIWLVWDNWPVHAHHKVLEALARQRRVKVLWLPTYAPWLNPIEKAWRWTRQRVTHAHPWCDDFGEFRRQVMDELERLRHGSRELLHYVGLST
jgi:transposase